MPGLMPRGILACMARPTTWRRSWNLTQGIAGTSSVMDLLIVQPGETLGGTWWTYKAHAGPFASTAYEPDQSTTFMGLILRQDGDPIPDPLVDLGADWLWWEPVTWQTTASASTDLIWLHYAWGPRTERKAESQRRALRARTASLA